MKTYEMYRALRKGGNDEKTTKRIIQCMKNLKESKIFDLTKTIPEIKEKK